MFFSINVVLVFCYSFCISLPVFIFISIKVKCMGVWPFAVSNHRIMIIGNENLLNNYSVLCDSTWGAQKVDLMFQ